MPIRQVLTDKHKPVKVFTDELDEAAAQQLRNVASLPFVHHHVAAMPDVHWGLGATIGSVIPTVGAIIPATIVGRPPSLTTRVRPRNNTYTRNRYNGTIQGFNPTRDSHTLIMTRLTAIPQTAVR